MDLPTYAFQHQRYWLESGSLGSADASSLGLGAAHHPLLGAAVQLADGNALLLTGRVSLRTHPWLADHTVRGTVLLPGTALVELALRAGDAVDCAQVEELTLETPLVLPEQGAVQVQVRVGAAEDEAGRRSVTVHSRPEDAQDQLWVRHASGVLAPVGRPAPAELSDWPPTGAEAVEIHDAYMRLAGIGLQYGPAFQGLRAAWRRGDELFAEVALPEGQRQDVARFGVHPALLDSALHLAGLSGGSDPVAEPARLPFSWSGVTLHATGAERLRVRLARRGTDGLSVLVADGTGAPVASVDSLVARPVDSQQLAGGRARQESLYELEWAPVLAAPEQAATVGWAVAGADELGLATDVESAGLAADRFADLAALADSGTVPGYVFVPCVSDSAPGDVASATRSTVQRVLGVVQEWLADERFAQSRLVLVTRRAVAAGPQEDVQDLASAAAWGLLRSAQTEHPGRFVLADVDGTSASVGALCAALTQDEFDEPQLAVRQGVVSAVRLARAVHAEVAHR
ncbi:polyketide synthase dehydratase domain-containing protein, partial [Streptomyces sp. NK08204]|uniref:SpnB-like Rossmann fold domain-containing protein n=1 Tax=Streptomyces sp. NK08204 TaxID=2873260 RepID=UPI001CEC1F2A